jgi:hypothetical protein
MGLLKLIKNIFSKKKKDPDNLENKGLDLNIINAEKEEYTQKEDSTEKEEKTINNDFSYKNQEENNYLLESNKKIKDQKDLNDIFNKENYLENDRILKLKYLNQKNNVIEDNVQTVNIENIIENQMQNIWDIIKIKENTQAEHIIKSIPSDKWVTMDEIKHNIKINFNIEYSNEKSLYPYLKTLTDINLIKLNNVGKKRSWKKNIILLK